MRACVDFISGVHLQLFGHFCMLYLHDGTCTCSFANLRYAVLCMPSYMLWRSAGFIFGSWVLGRKTPRNTLRSIGSITIVMPDHSQHYGAATFLKGLVRTRLGPSSIIYFASSPVWDVAEFAMTRAWTLHAIHGARQARDFDC